MRRRARAVTALLSRRSSLAGDLSSSYRPVNLIRNMAKTNVGRVMTANEKPIRAEVGAGQVLIERDRECGTTKDKQPIARYSRSYIAANTT